MPNPRGHPMRAECVASRTTPARNKKAKENQAVKPRDRYEGRCRAGPLYVGASAHTPEHGVRASSLPRRCADAAMLTLLLRCCCGMFLARR